MKPFSKSVWMTPAAWGALAPAGMILASFGHLGYDVVEMVLADQDGWDRYEAAKWLTMRRWLEANPDDDFAKDVRAELTSAPKRYAAYKREYLVWVVFALIAR